MPCFLSESSYFFLAAAEVLRQESLQALVDLLFRDRNTELLGLLLELHALDEELEGVLLERLVLLRARGGNLLALRLRFDSACATTSSSCVCVISSPATLATTPEESDPPARAPPPPPQPAAASDSVTRRRSGCKWTRVLWAIMGKSAFKLPGARRE